MSDLATAIAITAKAFENKLDKGGKPYILHCLRVMLELRSEDEELNCIAVMHDLIEDYPEYEEVLINKGFSNRVMYALRLLNHKEKTITPYERYIKMLSYNADAVLVKRADLIDNSNIMRLKGLTRADFDRMEKYHKAFVYLSKI